MKFSIITATYNRADYLPRIYDNLQTNHRDDYEWLLIDDGSSDDTEELANKWIVDDLINFRYIKKKNEGKANAIHYGFQHEPKGQYSLVLDSDDMLYTGILLELWAEIQQSMDCIGLAGLKADESERLIGSEFGREKGKYVDIYYQTPYTTGDKMFVIKTDLYKSQMQLSFPNEKMLPDSIVFIKLHSFGEIKFINKVIYCGEYLNDGWSSNIKKLIENNTQGMIHEKKLLQSLPLSFKHKVLNTIKYCYYCLIAKIKIRLIIQQSNDRLLTSILLPVGWLYYKLKWKD